MVELMTEKEVKEANELAARALRLLADIVENNGYLSTLEVTQRDTADFKLSTVDDVLVIHCETILKENEKIHVLNLLSSFARKHSKQRPRKFGGSNG